MKMMISLENDNDMNDMIQYNFERITDLSDLIVPIYFSFYMKKLEEKVIQQFNNYMLILYKEEQFKIFFLNYLMLKIFLKK